MMATFTACFHHPHRTHLLPDFSGHFREHLYGSAFAMEEGGGDGDGTFRSLPISWDRPPRGVRPGVVTRLSGRGDFDVGGRGVGSSGGRGDGAFLGRETPWWAQRWHLDGSYL